MTQQSLLCAFLDLVIMITAERLGSVLAYAFPRVQREAYFTGLVSAVFFGAVSVVHFFFWQPQTWGTVVFLGLTFGWMAFGVFVVPAIGWIGRRHAWNDDRKEAIVVVASLLPVIVFALLCPVGGFNF